MCARVIVPEVHLLGQLLDVDDVVLVFPVERLVVPQVNPVCVNLEQLSGAVHHALPEHQCRLGRCSASQHEPSAAVGGFRVHGAVRIRQVDPDLLGWHTDDLADYLDMSEWASLTDLDDARTVVAAAVLVHHEARRAPVGAAAARAYTVVGKPDPVTPNLCSIPDRLTIIGPVRCIPYRFQALLDTDAVVEYLVAGGTAPFNQDVLEPELDGVHADGVSQLVHLLL